MKKILLLASAFLLSGGTANAQTAKELEQLTKKLERSDLSVLDAKKVPLFATWIDRANVLIEVSKAYTSKLIPGIPTTQLFPMLAERSGSVEEVTELGVAKKRHVFTHFDLYTDENDNVVSWITKQEMKPGALDAAFEALNRAKTISPAEFSGKGYFPAENLWNEYSTLGSNHYFIGEKITAADYFKKAIRTKELRDEVDSVMTYQTGMAYLEAQAEDSALVYLNKALEIGYDMDGDVQFYISLIEVNKEHMDKAVSVLEDAAKKYPDDSRIMTQLVKLYIDTNKDPDEIISILNQAKALDPDNIQMYMVEGEMWNRLGDDEKSAAAFAEAIRKDPKNVMAYKNIGILQYDLGDEVKEKAGKAQGSNDLDAYDALQKQAKANYDKAIEMFEKAHELAPKDPDVIGWLRELYYYNTDRDVAQNQQRFKYFNDLYNEL